MGFVITAYAKTAFHMFRLPNIDNTNYTVTLDGQAFQLHKNLNLHFEVLDGLWSIQRSAAYSLECEGEDGYERTLEVGQVFHITVHKGATISLVVMPGITALHSFEKFALRDGEPILVGKAPSCQVIFDYQGLLSQQHLQILRQGGKTFLQDLSTNGVFINWNKMPQTYEAHYGDCVNIFGLCLVFLGDILAVGTLNGTFTTQGLQGADLQPLLEPPQEAEDEKAAWIGDEDEDENDGYYQRAPRNLPEIYEDPINIEAPPPLQKKDKPPLLMTIGPSFTMAIPMLMGSSLAIVAYRNMGTGGSSAYMYTGVVTAVMSAILGVVWALLNLRYANKQEEKFEKNRFERYRLYLLKRAEEIKEKYQHNTQALRELYPPAQECCDYDDENKKLWNRNFSHQDLLTHRLGLGSVPFQVPIAVPPEKFTLYDDSLADKPAILQKTYEKLEDVPLCIDLMDHRLIGIVGGVQKKGADDVVRDLAVQIAANNCYTDVKMMFISDKSNFREQIHWDFARWLPHVWGEDHRTRYFATDVSSASDVFYALSNVLRIRAEQAAESTSKKVTPKPQFVVFISDYSLIEGEPVAKYILEPDESYGLTTFLLTERVTDLPNSCEFVIENSDEGSWVYNLRNIGKKESIALDHITLEQAEHFARRLAPIQVNELDSGGGIPSALNFFDMYGITKLEELKVMERWQKNRTYENMRALVGQKAGNQNWYLDINEKYHGPHGLVAGTTGSGKSETLQTYILSLGINFSPRDVAFFIIDFKGGGMANLFSNLPHMAGQISNLSGNQVHRAMVAIKSENHRRQRLFNEAGVNSISQYTRLVKNGEVKVAIPHLLIIIDEFAELKREEPDFMRELISVAQVGRSLGVHMILATQKPSGTVDDNIWSNSKFRLCLRVQDRQDSMDMLHRPDAAYITQAGRCYMQVGNDEVFELFQSGWSGATYVEGDVGKKNEIVTIIADTGKSLVVGSRTVKRRKEQRRRQWLERVFAYVEAASRTTGIPLEHLTQGDGHLAQLAQATCGEMLKDGTEYGDSAASLKKLEDFILLRAGGAEDVSEIEKLAALSGCQLPEEREKTQLDAVIEYLGKIAQESGQGNQMQLWLPVLSNHILLQSLAGFSANSFDGKNWPKVEGQWELSALVGMYDDPANQLQQPLPVSFSAGGHLAVCGTVVSGKSTLIQTLMYALMCKYPPDYVNFYCLDFSSKKLSAFEGSAHVGGILYENDLEKCNDLFAFIQKIMQDRKEKFHGGDYSQYVRVNGVVVPSIILVIDNYANFLEKTGGQFDDILLSLSREGEGYGIYLLASASGFGMTGIPNRLGDNFRTVLCLEMGDKFKYADAMHVTHIDVMPEEGIKGRGLAATSNGLLEFQTALCLEAEDDYSRAEKLKDMCRQMRSAWSGNCARPIPTIPENPTWENFSALEDFPVEVAKSTALPIGWRVQDASLYSVPLLDTYCYLIQGKPRTGKTTLLKLIAQVVAAKKAEITVVDFGQRLGRFAESISAQIVTNSEELFDYWQKFVPAIQTRNARKQELLAEGSRDSEIFAAMQDYPPIFILIDDLTAFIRTIYDPKETAKNMSGFLENIIAKGQLHNIYFVACLNPDEGAELLAYPVYKTFIGYQTGIHLGGNASAQRTFDFSSIPFSQLSKNLKIGTGLVPPSAEQPQAFKVVIPYTK